MPLYDKDMRARILVISGPSGAGKSSLERSMRDNGHSNILISHTSRDMRAGEANGKDYHFVSRLAFDEMVRAGAFLEYAHIYNGDGYGLAVSEAERVLGMSSDPATSVLNTEGFRKLRDLWPSVWGVWIDAPNDQLSARMLARGDSPEKIKQRLDSAHKERRDASLVGYDFHLTNHDFGECSRQLTRILKVLRYRASA